MKKVLDSIISSVIIYSIVFYNIASASQWILWSFAAILIFISILMLSAIFTIREVDITDELLEKLKVFINFESLLTILTSSFSIGLLSYLVASSFFTAGLICFSISSIIAYLKFSPHQK